MCSLDIVDGSEDVIIINDAGVIIRTSVGEISQYGRDTQGVKLMNLGEDTRVASVCYSSAGGRGRELRMRRGRGYSAENGRIKQ